MSTPDQPEQRQVDLTIVIPTFNRRDRLLRVLTAVDRQTTRTPTGRRFTFEIVVVSDGSTDGTVEALNAFTTDHPLRVVDQENGGPSRARNSGAAAARGDLILFLDDDVVPAPECAGVHIDRHADRDGLVVIGPMLSPPDHRFSPWVAWEQHQIEKWYPYFEHHPAAAHHHFYTGNASVERSALLAAGGFDETLTRAEDVELAWRLNERGATFEMALDARAFHYAERSLDSWRSIASDYGRTEIGFIDRGDDDRRRLLHEKWNGLNPAVRTIVEWIVSHPRAARLVPAATERLALIADRLRATAVTRRLLSFAYILRFYAGAADALGPGRGLASLADESPVGSSGVAEP